MTSCFYPSDSNPYTYRGNYPEAYAVANYSLLGMVTSESDKVALIDTDEYGRALYLLRTRSWLSYENYAAVLVITQTNTDKEVLYNGFESTIYCFTSWFDPEKMSVQEFFTEKDVSALKEMNFWGTPLSDDHGSQKSIVCADENLIPKEKVNDVLYALFGEEHQVFYDPMASFDGNVVYLMGTYDRTNDQWKTTKAYMVVFYPVDEEKYHYAFEEVQSPDSFQEQLKIMLENME